MLPYPIKIRFLYLHYAPKIHTILTVRSPKWSLWLWRSRKHIWSSPPPNLSQPRGEIADIFQIGWFFLIKRKLKNREWCTFLMGRAGVLFLACPKIAWWNAIFALCSGSAALGTAAQACLEKGARGWVLRFTALMLLQFLWSSHWREAWLPRQWKKHMQKRSINN